MKKITNKNQLSIKFIDLFCGIGGFHQAIKLASKDICNIECVFSSDIDKSVQKTYFLNYGVLPEGDITKVNEENIPSHDFLFAGFPCQAFSVAGHRKGFNDIRGTLFFDVAKIAKFHQPKVILLENVKGLIGHDKGNTFKIILEVLTKELNYHVQYKVMNTAKHANIPQNRERVYIVATKEKLDNVFPEELNLTKTINDIIFNEKQDDKYYYNQHRYYLQLKAEITKKDTVFQWRRHYVRENKNNLCPTLTANMGTGGHNVPLIKDDFGIRKLTPQECLLFQGFDETFIFPILPESQKYKQVGNSISVPIATAIIKNILKQG
jgi:DNA (cytosine-5)-methyltransferase 1